MARIKIVAGVLITLVALPGLTLAQGEQNLFQFERSIIKHNINLEAQVKTIADLNTASSLEDVAEPIEAVAAPAVFDEKLANAELDPSLFTPEPSAPIQRTPNTQIDLPDQNLFQFERSVEKQVTEVLTQTNSPVVQTGLLVPENPGSQISYLNNFERTDSQKSNPLFSTINLIILASLLTITGIIILVKFVIAEKTLTEDNDFKKI